MSIEGIATKIVFPLQSIENKKKEIVLSIIPSSPIFLILPMIGASVRTTSLTNYKVEPEDNTFIEMTVVSPRPIVQIFVLMASLTKE